MGNPSGGRGGEREEEQGDLLGEAESPLAEAEAHEEGAPPSPPASEPGAAPPLGPGTDAVEAAREAARRRAAERVRGGDASPTDPRPHPELELMEDEPSREPPIRRGDRRRIPRGRDEEGSPPLTVGGERLARARELVRGGKVQEAIELYREVVSDHPQSLKARNNLGVLYDEMGQHEMALEQFEAARSIDPENVEVLGNLGAALLGLSRFEEAERELRRGMRIDPENVVVRASLGILHFRRGLYAQAEAELRWVCEHDYDHAAAHFYRGEALNRLGRVDQAIEVLERAVRLQPRNAKAYYTMGILFDKKHMPAEAAQMYRKARELAR